MKNLTVTICLTLAVLLGSTGTSWGADYGKGYAAYDSGDFATALREWRPLAEKGDARAQSNLGFMYTKGDVFEHFKCLYDKEITHKPQFSAGNFFIKKHSLAEHFLKNWIDIFEKKFDLIDDTPSKIKNFSGFVENRHDQSVFSILCKSNLIESLSAYEFDWAEKNNLRTWEHIIDYPFWAKRDLKYNFFKRFFNRQIKNFRRKKKKIFGG